MPELPEVETIKRELSKILQGKIISTVDILWFKTVSPTTVNNFKKVIINKKIIGLERKAKMLLIHLNQDISLLIHLKMTGQLIYVPNKGRIIAGGHFPVQASPTPDIQTPGKHTRLIFNFKDKSKLYFNDLRKFGWIKILDDKLKTHLETKLGLEPLSSKFTMVNFKKTLEKYPNRTVKQILLDQELIAGIGNIYADETAFLSKVLPMRKIKNLKEGEINSLYKNVIAVLKKSIKYKGTSSKNYVRSNGQKGGFVPHLMVYGRAGLICKICQTTIQKTKHAGRGTHYCPKCQK